MNHPFMIKRLISVLAACLMFVAGAKAQQASEEEVIKPSRPDVADPAEFQAAGVLQIEYGVDANFRAEDFYSQLRTPLTLRYAVSERLLIEGDFDVVDAEREQENGRRETGVGDVRLGFQIVAAKESEAHPALAFAYFVKLPTASEDKGLGTGRVDHKLVALLSKKFGKTEVDFNAAYLNVGREDARRRASGGQAAFALTRELNEHFDLITELSGQSEEDANPRGIYPLAALGFNPNKRTEIDGGVRFGIGREAPHVGVFAGVTFGASR